MLKIRKKLILSLLSPILFSAPSYAHHYRPWYYDSQYYGDWYHHSRIDRVEDQRFSDLIKSRIEAANARIEAANARIEAANARIEAANNRIAEANLHYNEYFRPYSHFRQWSNEDGFQMWRDNLHYWQDSWREWQSNWREFQNDYRDYTYFTTKDGRVSAIGSRKGYLVGNNDYLFLINSINSDDLFGSSENSGSYSQKSSIEDEDYTYSYELPDGSKVYVRGNVKGYKFVNGKFLPLTAKK